MYLYSDARFKLVIVTILLQQIYFGGIIGLKISISQFFVSHVFPDLTQIILYIRVKFLRKFKTWFIFSNLRQFYSFLRTVYKNLRKY